jgi:hypothetical protein
LCLSFLICKLRVKNKTYQGREGRAGKTEEKRKGRKEGRKKERKEKERENLHQKVTK